ncbi:MAG: hypothetical protein OEZ06_06825 [Myxococcales bacterium]|nr:hypothetical protein [Myxococcales bacterium]
MASAVADLEAALERERLAAIAADAEALMQIQEDKRQLLASLDQSCLRPAELERIRQRAMANIGLMRHLTACLRSLAGEEPAATYSQRGVASIRRGSLPPRGPRGAL